MTRAALVVLMCVPASAAFASDIYGFSGGPKFRGMTTQDLICNEMVGATDEQNAALKEYCEQMGFKWQGRSGWSVHAHEKQRELDALRQMPVNAQ